MENTKITEKNGEVVAIMQVSSEDEVMLISRNGKILRIDSDRIRATGRLAQGVRLATLEADDAIAAATVVPDTEELAALELNKDEVNNNLEILDIQ